MGTPVVGIQTRTLIVSTIDRFTIALVRTAALAGHQPYVATDRRWGVDRLSVHARRRLVLDHDALVEGTPEALARLNEFIRHRRIDLVVPADTRCTRMLSRCGTAVQGAALFPMPSTELFDRLYDKWHFYELLANAGLATPRTVLAASVTAASEIDLRFPVVIKPRQGENGHGVYLLNDKAALSAALRSADREGRLPLLVQEWIPGWDIDLDLCADRGELTVWLAQIRDPQGMHFVRDERVFALGRAICRAVGYHGVAHVDMRVDNRTGEVVVIEFNPRFWGSLIWASWTGVNFLSAGAALVGVSRQPTFAPIHGTCPFLGATPGVLAHWLRWNLRPPGWLPVHHQAWKVQARDPLPEILEWLIGRFTRRKAPPSPSYRIG